MPYHSNSMPKSKPKPKAKVKKMDMKGMSDAEYYKEHKKHHSAEHIKAMKELQRLGVDRMKAHNFVKKYLGK